MQYIINAVDPGMPREWDGPNGKVYYITVSLEGVPKPVSIGKKSPDALKVGDEVWGTIIPTDFPTDKWRGEAPPERQPQASGQTAGQSSDDSPSYEAGTNARWALKLSLDTFKSVLGRVPEGDTDYEMIKDFAGWLLRAFDELKTNPLGTQISGTSSGAKASRSEQSAEDIDLSIFDEDV